MKEMEEPGTETEKRGGMTHHRRGRHARGGKAEKVNVYNAAGSPEVREAEDEEEDFKHGGKAKRKHGGHAEGEMAMHRADRMPRGRRAAGGAVALAKGGRAHHGHGGHHHDGHEHEVEHKGEHGVHHHGAHGHAVHHHGDGDIHVHKKKGGEVHREKRARGGRAMHGNSPYSSARNLSGETGGGAAAGHEGQKVPAEPG